MQGAQKDTLAGSKTSWRPKQSPEIKQFIHKQTAQNTGRRFCTKKRRETEEYGSNMILKGEKALPGSAVDG
jgi:hypothetical protein